MRHDQINRAGEAIDAKESVINGYADAAFGMAATCPVGNNIAPQYGDTDQLKQWLLEVYPNYLHTIPYGFDCYTKKAWRDAAHNFKTHVEAVEQQAA